MNSEKINIKVMMDVLSMMTVTNQGKFSKQELIDLYELKSMCGGII